ncbi:MAG: hypothetical protein IKU29_02275 [Parabacteroides sp.]|nr:hypothetical protein [Parabacteroides sp.]
MSQIVVKFDNQLIQTPITIPLIRSSVEESGADYKDNPTEIQQSSVYGIISPLIAINDIVIDFDNVKEFNLKSSSQLPTVSMVVYDRYGLINLLDNPSLDNEVRVQILPPFENAYKKINLTFYITSIRISQGKLLTITGSYKLPSLSSSKFKSFGQKNTYTFFENIAKETGLGFASNISDSNDMRCIYCDNKSYIEMMNQEINRANADNIIMDWWVDFWNNINLVDIMERYNTIDKNLMVWVSRQNGLVGEGLHITPIQTSAILSNHPSIDNSELYVEKYDVRNRTGLQVTKGTDKIYSVYFEGRADYNDTLIMDGDVKNDIYIKHEYLGEVYGDYNYLLSEKKRDSFLQKINTESIEVTTRTPLLGLMRGHRVNFQWYINDSVFDAKVDGLEKNGVISTPSPKIPMYDDNDLEPLSVGNFILDKSVSGQYLITSSSIRYYNNRWEHVLILNRPSKDKLKLINR